MEDPKPDPPPALRDPHPPVAPTEDLTTQRRQPEGTDRRVTFEAYQWAAPLPDPRTLREYAQLLPDLPDRIVTQWEKQTDHRIENERKVIDSNIVKEGRGQWMGFSIFLTGMVGAIVLLAMGMTPTGLAVFFADLTAMVTVFLRGGQLSAKQLEEQREALREEEQRDLFEDGGTPQVESGDQA